MIRAGAILATEPEAGGPDQLSARLINASVVTFSPSVSAARRGWAAR